jgi:hypothetical protein
VRTGGKYFSNGEIKSYLLTAKGYLIRVNIMTKLFFDLTNTDIQMVGMLRKINSRTENKQYLLMDSRGNIVAATQNFLMETGLCLAHLRNFQFNIGLFSPEIKDDLFEQKARLAVQKSIGISSAQPEKTSTNLVSMMMTNMKANNVKTLSTNSSEEEDEFKKFEGVSIGKLLLPSNLRDVLTRFSA